MKEFSKFLLFSSFVLLAIAAAQSELEFVFTSQETIYIDLFEKFKTSNFIPVSINQSDYLNFTFPNRNITTLIDSDHYYQDISCVSEDKDLNYLFVVYSQVILVVYDIRNGNFSQIFNLSIPDEWTFHKCLEIKYALTFELDYSSVLKIRLLLYYLGFNGFKLIPMLSFLEGNASSGFQPVTQETVDFPCFCRHFPKISINESYLLVFCENDIEIHQILPNLTIIKIKEIKLDGEIHSILAYPCMNDKWNCSEEVKFLVIFRNNTITRGTFNVNKQGFSFYQINFTLDLNNEIATSYYHQETNEFYILTRKYGNEQSLIVLDDNYDFFTQNTFSYDFPFDLKLNLNFFKRSKDFLSFILINRPSNKSYLNLFKVTQTEISLYYQTELETENLYHYKENEFFYSRNSNLYKFEVNASFLLEIQAKKLDTPTQCEITLLNNKNETATLLSNILPSDFSGMFILNKDSAESSNLFEDNMCLTINFDRLLVNTNFTKIHSIQDFYGQYNLNKIYEKCENLEINGNFFHNNESSLTVYDKIFEVSAYPFNNDKKFIFVDYNASKINLRNCFFNLWSFDYRKKLFDCDPEISSINLSNSIIVKIHITFQNIIIILYKNDCSPNKTLVKIEENVIEIDLILVDFIILNDRNLKNNKNSDTDILFQDIQGNLHQFHLIMNPFKLENKLKSVYDLANKAINASNLSITHYFLVNLPNETKISLLAFEKNKKEFWYFSLDFSNEIFDLHKNFSSESIQNSSLNHYQIYFTSKKNVLIVLVDMQVIEEFSFFPCIHDEEYYIYDEFPNIFFHFYRSLPIPKNLLISEKMNPILSVNDKLYVLLKDLNNCMYNIYVYDVKKTVTSTMIVGTLINESFDQNDLFNLSISVAESPNSVGRDIILIKTRNQSYFVSFDGEYVLNISKNFIPASNYPENSSQVSSFQNLITLNVTFSNNLSNILTLTLHLMQENSFSEQILVKKNDSIVMTRENIISTKGLVDGHVFLDKIIELSPDKSSTLISDDFHEIIKLRNVFSINDKTQELNNVRYLWGFEDGFLAVKNDMLLKLSFLNGQIKVDRISTQDFSNMFLKDLLIMSKNAFFFIFKDKQRKFQYYLKNSNCSFYFIDPNNQCNSGFLEGLLDYDAVDLLKPKNESSNNSAVYFLNIAEEYNVLRVYSLTIEKISFEFEYRFNYTFDLNLEKFLKTDLILDHDHLILILNNNHLCVFIVSYVSKQVLFSEVFHLDSDSDQNILNFEVLPLSQTSYESYIVFDYLLIINYQFSSARGHFLEITKTNGIYFVTPQNIYYRQFLHFPGCEYSRKGFSAFIKNNQTIVLRPCKNFDKEAILLFKSDNSDCKAKIDYYAQGSSSFFYKNEIQNIIFNDTFLHIFTKNALFVYEVFSEETYFHFPNFKENLILRRMNFYNSVDFKITAPAPDAEESSNGYVWIIMMCLIGLIAFITFMIISYCLFIRRKYYKEKKHFFLSHGDFSVNQKEKIKIIDDSSEEKKEEGSIIINSGNK